MPESFKPCVYQINYKRILDPVQESDCFVRMRNSDVSWESLFIRLESPFDLLIFHRKPAFVHVVSQEQDATLISNAKYMMQGMGVELGRMSHFSGTQVNSSEFREGGGCDRRTDRRGVHSSALCAMSGG